MKRNVFIKSFMVALGLIVSMLTLPVNMNSQSFWSTNPDAGKILYEKQTSNGKAQAVVCYSCNTGNKCKICGGLGYIVPTKGYSAGQRVTCNACIGSGKCPVCSGKGYLFMQFSQDGVYVDGKFYSAYAAKENKKERISQRSKKQNTSCTYCGNTGIDPSPSSGGDLTKWLAVYHHISERCAYCNEISTHWHTWCPRCNIPQ